MDSAGVPESALERGRVQQSAPGTDTRRVGDGLTGEALPGGVTTVAASGARLMADQDSVGSGLVSVRAVPGWQDHPAALGTGHEVPEAGRHDGNFQQSRLLAPLIKVMSIGSRVPPGNGGVIVNSAT
jgi:hypothetical protein